MQKTKKQHFVPRCYLENFQIPNSYRIHVYDKNLKKSRINSINDIASENYFYDIKFSEILPEDKLDDILKGRITAKDLDDEQYIERYLATTVETEYAKLLDKLIQNISSITPWIAENCFFISETQKVDFSVCLAMQYVRTKSVREGILESADCLMQALDDMNATQRLKDSMRVTKEASKYIHGKMILDKKDILEATQLFNRLTWVLGINKTKKLLYTSDSPIGTKAHLSDPIISMSGLSSKGVEVFFPLTPSAILIMFDGDYHKNLASQDRNYIMMTMTENIDYYNSLCVMRSDRCIYSTDGDFTLIDQMIKKDSHALDTHRTELRWGGKTYYPRKTV